MTQISPYRPTTPPLTAGARFIRGFRRIGIVLGSMILIGGATISFFIARDQQLSAENRFDQASCIAGKFQRKEDVKPETYDASKIDLLGSGCFGTRYSMSVAEVKAYSSGNRPAPMEYMVEPLYFGALITVGSAIAVYTFFWLVGWLCAGFTRD